MCTRAHTLHGMQGIRNPMLNLVNEPGLYSLILRSKVTAAEMQRRRSVSCVRVRQVPPLAVRDHVPAGQKKGDVSFLQLPAGVNYATSVGLAAAKPPMRHLWTGGRENHGYSKIVAFATSGGLGAPKSSMGHLVIEGRERASRALDRTFSSKRVVFATSGGLAVPKSSMGHLVIWGYGRTRLIHTSSLRHKLGFC